jgi:hypothetical protein
MPLYALVTNGLWRLDEGVLFCATIVAFGAILELAFRLGRRYGVRRSDEAAKTHSNALQAALLGLLAILLAFNFAMADARYEARKALLQEEVNAIRTTYMRALLLPPPQRQAVLALLRTYVATRLEFGRAGIDPALLEVANASTAHLEAHLWTLVRTVAAHHPSEAATGEFMQAVNDMVNVTEKRRAAQENHVPEVVLHLLFLVAMGALGFIAYGYGLTGQRRHSSTALFAVLIALVLTLILDLDRPRRGFIRVSEDSLLRLQATLGQDTP